MIVVVIVGVVLLGGLVWAWHVRRCASERDGGPGLGELAEESEVCPSGAAESLHTGELAEVEEERQTDVPRFPRKSVKPAHSRGSRESTVTAKKRRKRIRPPKIGGRRGKRDEREPADGREAQTKRHTGPRFGLVCFVRERTWYLGVQVGTTDVQDEESGACRVLQDGRSLCQRPGKPHVFLLQDLHSPVQVCAGDGKPRQFELPGPTQVLVFRLDRRGTFGRRVLRISSGWHLLVVDRRWTPVPTGEQTSVLLAEPTSIEGYVGYVIHVGEEFRFHFLDEGGERVRVPIGGSKFELHGCLLRDAYPDAGPLYVGEIPRLRLRRGSGLTWENVGWIVVGEEGRGKKARTPNLEMPPEPIEGGEVPLRLPESGEPGWFFVRVYDQQGQLIESHDFRYARDLYSIELSPEDALPSEQGHRPVDVRIRHGDEVVLIPASEEARELEVSKSKDRSAIVNVFTVPVSPEMEEFTWRVARDECRAICIRVRVERVWWTIGPLNQVAPEGWSDQSLTVTRSKITPTSDQGLWIRLPSTGWVKSVSVGLERATARTYPVRVDERNVVVPLRDLCYVVDGADTALPIPVYLWLPGLDRSAEILRIMPSFTCPHCNFGTESLDEIVEHAVSNHLESYFEKLSYEQIAKLIGGLPRKIYLCPYCGHYVRADWYYGDPTTAMFDHQESHCSAAQRVDGLVKIQFRVVSDPDIVREEVIKNLPYMFRCRVCQELLTAMSEAEIMKCLKEHLRDEHGGYLQVRAATECNKPAVDRGRRGTFGGR